MTKSNEQEFDFPGDRREKTKQELDAAIEKAQAAKQQRIKETLERAKKEVW